MLTIQQIIDVAKVSQYLAAADRAKGNLFGQRKIPITPEVLYMERKAVEWMYNIDPANSTLRLTANYLLSLCRGYNLQALNIVNAGSSGSISPITPSIAVYPLVITSANFESDGVSYNNPDIVGDNLMIFINEWTQQWLFAPTSFVYTATGIQIVLPGFDANNFDYNIIIQKAIFAPSSAPTPPFSPSDLPNLWAWYDASVGVTGTTSVTQWADQSGSGHDLISESGQEPALTAAALNGNPVIGPSSGVARMRTAATFPDTEQNLSIYIVAKQTVGAGVLADNNGYFLTTGALNFSVNRSFNGITNDRIAASFKGMTALAALITDDTYVVIRFILSPNDNSVAINDVVVASNTSNLFDLGADRLNVFSNATGSNFGNKQIAELLIYTDKHDSTEITEVQTYLNDKYNIY